MWDLIRWWVDVMILVVVVSLVDFVAVSSRWDGIELVRPFVLSGQRSCSSFSRC